MGIDFSFRSKCAENSSFLDGRGLNQQTQFSKVLFTAIEKEIPNILRDIVEKLVESKYFYELLTSIIAKNVKRGEQGPSGYSPEKGKDYFTDQEISILPRLSSWGITTQFKDPKRRIGFKVKRILDYGRSMFIENNLGMKVTPY